MVGFSDLKCRWHLIEPYEKYAITEFGDVYSYTPKRGLRQLKHRGINNPKRYLTICLSDGGNHKYLQIHRLVAKYFCDGYFEGAVVNHIDTDIHNNHYTNLEWLTQKENIHKSYISSGVDQTRNFFMYDLINPNGEVLGRFKGRVESREYIRANNLDTSYLSLARYGESRGYKLLKVDSDNNSNDYPLGA